MTLVAVGIGTSLGGLLALRRLLGALPACSEAAFVVVQHRAPDSPGRLCALLESHSVMPVREPEDFETLAGGTVYVAPADYHLLIDRGRLLLSVDEPVCFARPSIDVLLDSLAEAYRASSVAVILTGASADGALGAKAVARSGGAVLVQTPATAESPIAPRAALDMVPSARSMTIEQIADTLTRRCGARAPRARSTRHDPPERG